jgi:hypothetical protein
MTRRSTARAEWHAGATRLLKEYSERGVFRGQAAAEAAGGSCMQYRLRWHRGREFCLRLDRRKQEARVMELLPAIPARSAMYRELKQFIESFQNGSRPSHRSVDRKRVRLAISSRAGRVALVVQMHDADYEYAMNRLLTLIHETYMGFILGTYDAYRVEHLGADPDWGK